MSSLSTNGRTSYRLQSSCVAPPASGRARPRGGVSLGSSAPSEGRTAMGPDPPKCAESPEKDTRRRRRSARLLLKKRALDESNLPDIVRDVVRRRPPPAARPPPGEAQPTVSCTGEMRSSLMTSRHVSKPKVLHWSRSSRFAFPDGARVELDISDL